MLFYKGGYEVRVGDQVEFDDGEAVVEDIVEGNEVERWQLEQPGFLLVCARFGRIMINPGCSDWEEIVLVRRTTRD